MPKDCAGLACNKPLNGLFDEASIFSALFGGFMRLFTCPNKLLPNIDGMIPGI